MNPLRVSLFIGAVAGLLALVSAVLPWYSVAGLSFTLVSSVQSPPVCPREYCELIPVSPTLIGALVCTVFGGSLGIASTIVHRKSKKFSRILSTLGLATIIIGALISLSDAIVRDGLSIGFYTDSLSAVLFATHIVAELVRA